MKLKIANWVEDRLINLCEGLFWLYTVFVLVVVLGVTAYALVGQAVAWLENGYFPSRDGYWIIALFECGETWCRREYLALTDWVGVNRIINWFLDLHAVGYAIIITWVGFGVAVSWADSLGEWKAREQRLRAPPAQPDHDAD